IYPAEIENVLLDAPDVGDAAVVGQAHPDLGEVPVAFVVPAGDGIDEEALRARCRQDLTWFKVPAAIRFTDAIPRTGSGKVKRFELARLLDEPDAAEPEPTEPDTTERKVPS
ncbi:AMP-binding enzyme, partial [Actinomycetospora sp.]|uniref:AMP-binding enzyme n=1 Tax=Actinomycetospora sp. TaxID=1872135 RepID=UPI002F57C47D